MKNPFIASVVSAVLTGFAAVAGPGVSEEWLAWFDPEQDGAIAVRPPEGPVPVRFDFGRETVRINDRFYGINSHPLPAEEAFRNPELVRDLKPDSIRIMTNFRTFWYRENGVGKTRNIELSPERGKFNWESVDDLMKAIHSFGAEPYVALGFGAPRWLNTSRSTGKSRPLAADLPELADYMATVTGHLNKLDCGMRYVTVDNEPENVLYPFADYLALFRDARPKLLAAAPGIGIAGPATGYAYWKQPDGAKIDFGASLRMLREAGIDYAAIDWHVYSTNPATILKTADLVAEIYPGTPRFLSEFNLDWRYTGKGGEKSAVNNTSWNSVRWLAALWDGLQKRGVERTYYFCLRNRFFGLYDYNLEETRPAYHLFRFFTGGLSRQRVEASSGHPAVGVIATISPEGTRAAVLYNLSDRPVRAVPSGWTGWAVQSALSKEWYEANKAIRDGRAVRMPETPVDLAAEVVIPAGGAVLLRQEAAAR